MPTKEKPIKRQDGEEQNNGQRMSGELIKRQSIDQEVKHGRTIYLHEGENEGDARKSDWHGGDRLRGVHADDEGAVLYEANQEDCGR